MKKRIQNVQKSLKEKNVDMLIFDDFTSLFYLTGKKFSLGKIFISQMDATLFVDSRYIEAAKKDSGLNVELISEKTLSDFILKNKIAKIGFDSSNMTYLSYDKLKQFLEKIKDKNLDLDFKIVPINNPLKDFRLIKDSSEIASMKKAASLTWKGFEHVCLLLKENMTEKELAFEFEMFVKKNGAEKLSFDPIFSFGKNTSQPHHHPDNTKLKLNDIILMDVGVVVDGYCSDMTRVIFFGSADPKLEKLYSIVKQAQNSAISTCRPGIKLKEVDLAAREVLKKENLEEYFTHSLGHGVGLEVHEFPKIKFDTEDKDEVLKPGMVITIEPGLYIPDFGGVRYEDMILITSDGCENFYSST